MPLLNQISQEINFFLNEFTSTDSLIFKEQLKPFSQDNFQEIKSSAEKKTIAFIDGGQAEIINTGNFCLSFIRVFAVVLKGTQRTAQFSNEFYLFTKSVFQNNDLLYVSKIYPLTTKIIDEKDLTLSSLDSSIRVGQERAPIAKIANMARRFAELALARRISADYLLLDGTSELTFKGEDKYLVLGNNVAALAKTSSLFTSNGSNPVVLLNQFGGEGCWTYLVNEETSFVKLHPQAQHVFRFEGSRDILPYLIANCTDAVFLGYPYGLILADRMARVSNTEKKAFITRFLLKKENEKIKKYLSATNAHDILDNLS